MVDPNLRHVPAQLRTAARILRRLSANPWSLLVALLLLNALFRPYVGLVHDARFYAVQVLDRVAPGSYADDLYLRYGSQDAYSVFSWFAAPFVQAVGLRGAFFLLYLCSNAVFFFGLQRLVQALVKPRGIAILALVYVAVNPVPFGGLRVFHVHESFLTPRLLANGLVLLALERLLRNRPLASLALLTAALLAHPLMACSGLLVWVCWNLFARLGPRAIVILAISCGLVFAMVLGWTPLGTTLFGHMDDAWQKAAHAANFHTLPAEWQLQDWLCIGVAFALVAGARWHVVRNDRARRLLDSIIAVAALGTVVGWITPHVPYALLVQGQAYRALWLLQLVQVPLVFGLVAGLAWRGSQAGRVVALVLVPAFAYAAMTGWQFLSATLVLSLAYGWGRMTASDDDRAPAPVWLKLTAVVGVAAVMGPAIASALHAWRELSPVLPPVQCIQTIPLTIGPFLTWASAIGVLVMMGRLLTTGGRFRSAAVAGCLGVQIACFAVPESPLYRWMAVPRERDVEFIAHFLQQRRDGHSGLATVYWTAANLEDIWFALRVKSFYVTQQVAGNMFNRGTAIEGERRARLVSQFEMEAWRNSRYSLADWKRRSLQRIYDEDFDSASPTLEDLCRLCREEALDVAILQQRFDGWFSCTNGRWFIYECRLIREALAASVSRSANRANRSAGAAVSTGSALGAIPVEFDDAQPGLFQQPSGERPVSSPAAP